MNGPEEQWDIPPEEDEFWDVNGRQPVAVDVDTDRYVTIRQGNVFVHLEEQDVVDLVRTYFEEDAYRETRPV